MQFFEVIQIFLGLFCGATQHRKGVRNTNQSSIKYQPKNHTFEHSYLSMFYTAVNEELF
jgi:hypothetical protein